MDVVQAVSGYITKMVSAGDSTAGGAAAKMKILLLDSETVGLSVWSRMRMARSLSMCLGPHHLDCDHLLCPPQS